MISFSYYTYIYQQGPTKEKISIIIFSFKHNICAERVEYQGDHNDLLMSLYFVISEADHIYIMQIVKNNIQHIDVYI